MRIRLREPFCGISHGVGAALSVIGLVILLRLSWGHWLRVTAFSIYGASLIFLYTASALYHSLRVSLRLQNLLMRMDHAAIFVLIAGTYTPICLLALRPNWGWPIVGAEWGLAAIGIGLSTARRAAPDWLRVAVYLVMGWLIVIALGPLHRALPSAAFAGIVAGGLAYSLGVIVYATDRPHLWPGRFSAHDLWHLFVLAGSACHYVTLARFLAAP